MLVLALDTSTTGCSVAVVNGQSALAVQADVMPRGQSEALMPMVQSVMREADCRYSDIDLFAVTAGPGAFTGLRIGLAAARGMALAVGRPCLGITTFDALAYAVPDIELKGCNLLTIVESKRKDAFVQLYDGTRRIIGKGTTLLPEQIGDWLDAAGEKVDLVVTGDAVKKFQARLNEWANHRALNISWAENNGLPDPVIVARLAMDIHIKEGDDARSSHPARPVYLRDADVTLPASKPNPVG